MSRLLEKCARLAAVVGAAGSVALMLTVGRRNQSSFLMLLFAVWVLLPFLALGLAERSSRLWSPMTRVTLRVLMLLVTFATLGIYGFVAFGPPRPQPAAVFLIVPVASGLLAAITLALAVWMGRRSAGA